MQQEPTLAQAANETWRKAKEIHDRQTKKGGNADGYTHVKQVEENIWRLLNETHERTPEARLNIVRLQPMDLYLLSCAACCHDFDKGLTEEVLGGEFKHGEGSGKFVYENWDKLSLVSQAAAEYIDWIISIHDYKDDFDEQLQELPESPGLPDLQCLATLLKVADTLHMDESRISHLAVPDESLTGFDRFKQLARGNIHGWGPDGSSIVVTAFIKDEETGRALFECADFVKRKEWLPLKRNLREHQFPHEIKFEWLWPPELSDQKKIVGMMEELAPKGTDFGALFSESSINPTAGLVSNEPLTILAVQPGDLGEYLCESGVLSVIENSYIPLEQKDLGAKPGAVSRIYVGPANCGKTRAAYEWIKEKIGLNLNTWVVLRPESGSIPKDTGKFQIDWKARFGERRRRPSRAILFVDDLPNFLPPPGTGKAAGEPVRRLLSWFQSCQEFHECCFVGTIRTERMVDKPDWPERLLELGEDLRILRLESPKMKECKQIWQGMATGRADLPDGIRALGLQLEDDFIEAVAKRRADPETISYFVRAMADQGKERLTAEDATRFSEDVIGIWRNETWPAILDAYGPAASIFFTLARLFEGDSQPETRGKGGLFPSWEYHAVYGPPMVAENSGDPTDYVPTIERLLADGHASGVLGEWIRPKFDFLLQAPSLDDITVPLPPVDWFALHAGNLSPSGQTLSSYHLTGPGDQIPHSDVTAHWLYGYAWAMSFFADQDKGNTALLQEKELAAYDKLLQCFGEDKAPELREKVANGLFNKGIVLGRLGRDEDALEAYDELLQRFGEDEASELREQAAMGLNNKGFVLSRLGRDEDALKACNELLQRFGEDEASEIREKIAVGLINKGVTLGRLGRDEDAMKACNELLQRFGEDEAPELREQVAKGLNNKGLVLGRLGRDEDALEAYDDLMERFSEDEAPELREQVAKGLNNKGNILHRLGRDEDAVKAYDELLQRFGEGEAPELREQVAIGLNNKVLVLSRLWHAKQTPTLLEQAVEACRLLVSLGESTYNLACALSLKGELDEAFQLLGECLEDQKIEWPHVEKDTDWAHVKQDQRYKDLEAKYGADQN